MIKDKSILIFDDWNSGDLAKKNLGEKRAFDEFMNENPHLVAEEFGRYHYDGKPNGKLFIVTNTKPTNTSAIVKAGINLVIGNFADMAIIEGAFPVKLLNFAVLLLKSHGDQPALASK